MASIAEQLQTYRALYTNSRVVLQESASGLRSVAFTHPRTMEYFRDLTRRWQSGNREYNRETLPAGKYPVAQDL